MQSAVLTDGAPSPREQVRLREMDHTPAWYNPWAHLAATTGLSTAALLVGLAELHAVQWWQWLTVPVILVVSNAVEWRSHRHILHRRFPLLGVLYERHTPMHHKVYTYDDMTIRSSRELRMVLLPAIGVAALIGLTAPVAVAAGLVLGRNVGGLVLASSAFYVLSYELLHMAYHLPPDSVMGRQPWIRVLREHHRRHHHPPLMQRWNFNVTIPLWDWIRGTIVSDAQLRETLEQ